MKHTKPSAPQNDKLSASSHTSNSLENSKARCHCCVSLLLRGDFSIYLYLSISIFFKFHHAIGNGHILISDQEQTLTTLQMYIYGLEQVRAVRCWMASPDLSKLQPGDPQVGMLQMSCKQAQEPEMGTEKCNSINKWL